MKNKNTGFKHLVLLFAFILCLFSCVSAKAANYYYEDGYKYTLSLGKATIISYVGSDTDLTVPSILNGKPVVKIESSAFANNKNLCSVILPDTITWESVYLHSAKTLSLFIIQRVLTEFIIVHSQAVTTLLR